MKHLYIFDIPSYSVNNGVGTYIKQLLEMVKRWKDFQVSMIMLQTNAEAFFVGNYKGMEYFFLTKKESGHYQDNAEEICLQLESCIKDDRNNIFLLNYAPCEKLLYILKQTFPLSTCIFAMHDIRCLGPYKGDVGAIQNLLEGNSILDEQQKFFKQVFDNEKRQLLEADKNLCFCTDSYEFIKDFYQVPEQKVVLIPHGIEIEAKLTREAKDQFKEDKGIKDEIILLSVGRISVPKGFYDYLESFKLILSEGYNCKWIIIGDSRFADSFKEKAGDALSRIILTGFLNANELYKWYQIADIGIMPTYLEQCSYVGLEMMANGLPVVASDGFGVRSMFQHQFNALVASIGNREDLTTFQKQLSHSTMELIENHSLRHKLRINAVRKIKEIYNLNIMCKAYKKMLYE